MKNIFAILIISLLSTVQCYAQYFNQLIDFDTTLDWGVTIVPQSAANGFAVIGYALPSPGSNQIKWLTVDNAGAPSLKKSIFESPTIYYEMGGPYSDGKVLSNTKGYIVPLNKAYNYPTNTRVVAGICRINTLGDSVFTVGYSDTSQFREYAWDCDTANNGNLVLVIQRYPHGGTIDSFKAVMQLLDSAGGLKWTKQLTSPDNRGCRFTTVQYLHTGYILCGGASMQQTSKKIGNQTRFYVRNRPWMVLLDTLGNVVKEKLLLTRFAGGGAVYNDNNGGYFHVGVLDTFITNNPNDIQNLPWYFAHLNDSFQVDWSYDFGYMNGKKHLSSIEQLADSGYLIYGWQSDFSFADGHGWVARFDKNRALKWERNYYVDSTWDGYIVDALERPNGDFVFTGMHNSTATISRYQDVWIIGTDSLGCPSSLQCPFPTAVPEESNQSAVFNVFPNPTNGRVTISTSVDGAVQLFDVQGRKLWSSTVAAGNKTLELSEYTVPGLYFIKFISVKGIVAKSRVIYAK